MVDKFYLDVNLELFFQWIAGNCNKYDQGIEISTRTIDQYGKTINFIYHNISGSINIWSNGIIEEQIIDEKGNQLFYLHYELIDLKQAQKLFYDFYEALTKYQKHPPLKVIICCSGGLSSTFFATKLAELISLKHLNYEIIPIGFYQLSNTYQNCDLLYLAPQISYLEPKAMKIVENKMPVRTIATNIYATYNYRGLLDMITNEKITK